MGCPTPDELLRAALDGDTAPFVDRHVRVCDACARELEALRAAMDAVIADSLEEPPQDESCLDESEIAALVDGVDTPPDRSTIEHLASCSRCRARLGAVSRLVRDPPVAIEIAALEPAAPGRGGRRMARLGVAAALAAAALAGVTLWPELLGTAAEGDEVLILRERAITTAAAPQILAPFGVATRTDSLRWTSVPRADLYRVTVWNREGSVVWEGETRDTVLEIPSELEGLEGSEAAPLLWDVKARTGWGRWVASELEELTVGGPRRNR